MKFMDTLRTVYINNIVKLCLKALLGLLFLAVSMVCLPYLVFGYCLVNTLLHQYHLTGLVAKTKDDSARVTQIQLSESSQLCNSWLLFCFTYMLSFVTDNLTPTLWLTFQVTLTVFTLDMLFNYTGEEHNQTISNRFYTAVSAVVRKHMSNSKLKNIADTLYYIRTGGYTKYRTSYMDTWSALMDLIPGDEEDDSVQETQETQDKQNVDSDTNSPVIEQNIKKVSRNNDSINSEEVEPVIVTANSNKDKNTNLSSRFDDDLDE